MSSQDKYFNKFPVISYNGAKAIDITKRAAILEKVSANPYLFYPYEISSNERADQLSSRYYKDSYKSWTIYLANKIIDPYYEWYLTPKQFDEFIVDKYDSLVNAYDKTVFYRHHYAGVDNLDVSGFNALTPRLKQYWTPVYGIGANIIAYARKQEDWIINTNKIVKYETSNTSFTNNEIVNVNFDLNYTGTGQVVLTTNTSVYIQHTTGTTLSNNEVEITVDSYIYGRESGVNTAFSNSTLIVENLADEEEVYWLPVTYYDYENEKNEFNKTIRLIDNRFAPAMATELEKLMKE